MPSVDLMMKVQQHRVLTLITAWWVVGMLFVRVQLLVVQLGWPFVGAVRNLLPEIAVAAIFLLFLPAVWMRKPWVSAVLAVLAVFLLVLLIAAGFSNLWFVSFLLLLLLADAVRPVVPASDTDPAHPTMLLFLVLGKAPMYLGTPGAYLQLSAGALGAVDGFRRGHWSLATALLICSLLGLYGLWTMWSISARTWAHNKYVVQSEGGRRKDARGLLAAWIAVVGLAAMSTAIYRVDDVVILGLLLAPSLLVTTTIASVMTPEKIDGRRGLPLSGHIRRTSFRHYVGLVCGITVGVLALMPTTHWEYGYGLCPLTYMFPIGMDLWPTERPVVFSLHQMCDTGPFGQALLLAMASFVFWMSGLLTTVIGRSTDAWLGAVTAAVTALAVLTWAITARIVALLAVPLEPPRPISFDINWVSTIGIGIAVVLWAARLGYLGAARGARRDELRSGSPERSEPQVG